MEDTAAAIRQAEIKANQDTSHHHPKQKTINGPEQSQNPNDITQAASLTVGCEVLFNSLPLARKGSVLIIALVDASQFPSYTAPSPAATPAPAPAPASPTRGFPFVKYISDVNEAINEVRAHVHLRLAGNSTVVFIMGNEVKNTENEQTSPSSSSLELAELVKQEGLKVCWVSYSSFVKKYGFLNNRKPLIWYPSEVIDNFVFVGSKSQAKQVDQLKHLGISHLVSCIKSNVFSPQQQKSFVCENLSIKHMKKAHARALSVLDTAQQLKQRVMIFDTRGDTLSLAIVVQYLVLRKGYDVQLALSFVDSRRSTNRISKTIRSELNDFQADFKSHPDLYTIEAINKKGSVKKRSRSLPENARIFSTMSKDRGASNNPLLFSSPSSTSQTLPRPSRDRKSTNPRRFRYLKRNSSPNFRPGRRDSDGNGMRLRNHDPVRPPNPKEGPSMKRKILDSATCSTETEFQAPPTLLDETNSTEDGGSEPEDDESQPRQESSNEGMKINGSSTTQDDEVPNINEAGKNLTLTKRRSSVDTSTSSLNTSDSSITMHSISSIDSVIENQPPLKQIPVDNANPEVETNPLGLPERLPIIAESSDEPSRPPPDRPSLESAADPDNTSSKPGVNNPLDVKVSEFGSWITVQILPKFLHICVCDKEKSSMIDAAQAVFESQSSRWEDMGINTVIHLTELDKNIQSEDTKFEAVKNCRLRVQNLEEFKEDMQEVNSVLESVFSCEDRFNGLIDETILPPQAVIVSSDTKLTLIASSAFLIDHMRISRKQSFKRLTEILTAKSITFTTLKTTRELLDCYENSVFGYNRAESEQMSGDQGNKNTKYVSLSPRQLFNFFHQALASSERHMTQVLVWDTRSEEEYEEGHIKTDKVEAANMEQKPAESLANPDEMYRKLKNIRSKLAWKSWRLRDMIIYGNDSLSSSKSNLEAKSAKKLEHLAAYVATQMKIHGSCWLLSDFQAFRDKYPFLVGQSSKNIPGLRFGSHYRSKGEWYPAEILDGFLYYADMSSSVQMSEEMKKRLKDLKITDILAINSDIQVEGLNSKRVDMSGGIMENFLEYSRALHIVDQIRIQKFRRLVICSPPQLDSNNPLASPARTYSPPHAESLTLAYIMSLMDLTLGKTRQTVQDYYMSLDPDWKQLRLFSRRRKVVNTTSTLRMQNNLNHGQEKSGASGVGRRKETVQGLNAHQVFNLLSNKANLLILDLRPESKFNEGHIPRSISVPIPSKMTTSGELSIQKIQSYINDESTVNAEQKRKAISRFGKHHVLVVSNDTEKTKAVTQIFAGELQSASRKAELSYLRGGFDEFKNWYPGIVECKDLSSCFDTPLNFDSPLPTPTTILPGVLYLGNIADGASLKLLRALKIKRVILVVKHRGVLTFFPQHIEYMRLEPTPYGFMSSAILAAKFINAGKREGTATMIQGCNPDSAPASYAIAYLIRQERMSMVEAYQQIEVSRPTLGLSSRAASQVCDFECQEMPSSRLSDGQNEHFDFAKCIRKEPKEMSESEAKRLTRRIREENVKDNTVDFTQELPRGVPTKIRWQENSEVQYLKNKLERTTNEVQALEEIKDVLTMENRTLKQRVEELSSALEAYKSHAQSESEREEVFGDEMSDISSQRYSSTDISDTVPMPTQSEDATNGTQVDIDGSQDNPLSYFGKSLAEDKTHESDESKEIDNPILGSTSDHFGSTNNRNIGQNGKDEVSTLKSLMTETQTKTVEHEAGQTRERLQTFESINTGVRAFTPGTADNVGARADLAAEKDFKSSSGSINLSEFETKLQLTLHDSIDAALSDLTAYKNIARNQKRLQEQIEQAKHRLQEQMEQVVNSSKRSIHLLFICLVLAILWLVVSPSIYQQNADASWH